MTQPIPYWHVDAFADRLFGGNQAAVMLVDAWPDDETMRRIAAENMFAETAFLLPRPDGEHDLRWFTPASEVRMCGHATLASGHVVLGRDPAMNVARFVTRQVGTLEVRRAGAGYELSLPLVATTPGDYPAAVTAIGAAPQEVWRSPEGYTVLVYGHEDAVLALTPDFAALAALGNEQFIATAPGSASDITSRVFVPGDGIDEDAVTGSAHAVLAPIWAVKLGRTQFSALQASARGGRLDCRIDGDRVRLTGGCLTVVESRFYL